VEIFINDYSVDFELEGEQTLSQIVENVKEWSEKRGLIFLEFLADGKHYYIEKIPNIEVDDISQMNCIVQSKADLVFSTSREGAKYCDRVVEYISESLDKKYVDFSEVDNILNGLDWIVEMIGALLNIVSLKFSEVKFEDGNLDDFKNSIENYKNRLKNTKDNNLILDLFNEGKELFEKVKDILKIVVFSENMKKIIVDSVESPDNLISMLVDIKKELPEQIKNLEEIAIAFQTGNDQEGSNKISIFVDFTSKYLKACYHSSSLFEIDLNKIVIGESSLEDKNGELNDLLNEIVEVMENDDIISLSDIMEYEFISLFEDIKSFIDSLLAEISGTN